MQDLIAAMIAEKWLNRPLSEDEFYVRHANPIPPVFGTSIRMVVRAIRRTIRRFRKSQASSVDGPKCGTPRKHLTARVRRLDRIVVLRALEYQKTRQREQCGGGKQSQRHNAQLVIGFRLSNGNSTSTWLLHDCSSTFAAPSRTTGIRGGSHLWQPCVQTD